MYKITKKEKLAEGIFWMDIEARRIAKACQPGQFIIVRDKDGAERIPLTICDYDRQQGTISIVLQVMGDATRAIARLERGEIFTDVAGPLGRPSDFILEPFQELREKNIIFVAGGVGMAPVYPQVKWLHEQGIAVEVIAGFRNKDLVIMESQMASVCKTLHITTDDGSYGQQGLVTDVLRDLVEAGNTYERCVTIGPMIMMKFVCLLTKELNIPTIVSMNPIMVDGTGMCGACRVTVGGTVQFACVDGPEFDGHLIDFDEALKRMTLYKKG